MPLNFTLHPTTESGHARGYEGWSDIRLDPPPPIHLSSHSRADPTGSDADEWDCERRTAATCAPILMQFEAKGVV